MRKWIAAACAAAAFAGVVSWLTWRIFVSTASTFSRHEGDVARVFRETRAKDASRPPLFGDGAPGNAFDLHVRAISAIAAMPTAEANEVPELHGGAMTPDDAKLDAIVTKYSGAIEDLRRALSARDVVPDYKYEDAASMLLPHVAGTIRAAKYLSGMAMLRHRQGRDAEALELLALGIGTGHDMARRGVLVCALVDIVVEGIEVRRWREILAEHSLSAAELRRATDLLDRLDRGRPTVLDALVVEDAVIRRTILTEAAAGGTFSASAVPAPHAGWRQVFSFRVMCAQALNETQKAYAELGALRRLPPQDRAAEAERTIANRVEKGNAILDALFPAMSRAFRNQAIADLNWTLARVATAAALYEAEEGRPPAALADLVPKYLPSIPDCPYTGTPLHCAPGKVWSIGGDRKDDGGTPGRSDDVDSAGDVVWTVRRK